MASVKVAVRVRPFNQREKEMDAKLIIQMEGNKTRILNSKAVPGKDGDHCRERYKDFTFDHSYWSFDESDTHFVGQQRVFEDLGTEVVDSAFEGYNACVFAYGQTGSGKTYTMMGSADCQGLTPRICEALFARMQEGRSRGASYRTEVSYLEIYNERVKDLLRGGGHSLRVREHPRRGPYVQDLSRHLVSDYSDILELMKRGNSQRTTASTNMNDTSSRSHAIFTIMFVQAGFSNNMPSETESKVHLVDLAGSERADASGATGQRLKEGAHINKSLVTLGSVISALAELSCHTPGRTPFIPYRDSVLTWLLKDSLGGNSRTIMIAAVSPADCNHGETLSTLRYANRAKNIINKPTINEDSNVKLIRDLREEISKLRALLGTDHPMEAQPQMLATLQEKEAQEKVLTEEWAEKWRETQKILQEQKALGLRKSGTGVVLDSDRPHLVGIDDDVLSTGVTLYHLCEGETVIGSEGADIVLSGGGVESTHCSIELREGVATLVPHRQAQCWVNTQCVDRPTRLSQGCIILLGHTNMFRYNDPAEAAKLRKEGSRSHLNLSRLSLLSWSTPDLVSSTEACSEDPERLEEERARLLQEKEAFKKEQEARELGWQREQEQRQEALAAAQRELEEERHIMERDYAEQCRRLALDWRRLEQHQQDSLAALRLREAELHRQGEELRGVREETVAQAYSEGRHVLALRTELEARRRQFAEFLAGQLRPGGVLGGSGVKSLQVLAAEQLDSSPDSWASLPGASGPKLHVLRELVDTHKRELATLESELQNRVQALAEHRSKVSQIDQELEGVHACLKSGTAEFETIKQSLAQRTQQQLQELAERKQSLSLDLKGGSPPDLEDSALSSSSFHTATSPHSQSTSSFENVSLPGVGRLDAMRSLCQQVARQRAAILRSLEAGCTKSELDAQIVGLQELQRRYVRLELAMERPASSEESDDMSTSADDGLSDLLGDSAKLDCDDGRTSPPSPILRDGQISPTSHTLYATISCRDEEGSLSRYSISLSSPRAASGELLVHIPGYMLRGAGAATHYEYEVRVSVAGEHWTLLRRYKRFRELHLSMRSKYGTPVEGLSFPPRRFFSKNSEAVARQRRRELEMYLQCLLEVCSCLPNCPLYCASSKMALLEFSAFFRKGVFESSKYGTS